MQMRKHQKTMKDVIDGIIAGSSIKKIIVHATPGSGKSALPIIAGSLIENHLVDALCWVAPRTALQDQGERTFIDPFFRKMFDHSLTIRSSTNEWDPCRGQDGLITTTQAVCMDQRQSLLNDFKKKDYVLVLDEFHHFEEDSIWHKAVTPIVLQAKYLVLMTGTLERNSSRRIAFTPYIPNEDGGWVPRLTSGPETAIIDYSRTDALKEGAILPIEFHLSDAKVRWLDKGGKEQNGYLSTQEKKASSALFTALDTDFAIDMMDKCLDHWYNYNLSAKSPGKLLVITASIDHAKKFTDILNKKGVYSKIAASHESTEALANIKEFKFGQLHVLVTCQICYEGLDVPEISHELVLTHIRSTPWIEQAIARAVRINRLAGSIRKQRAYIFAPDDYLFRNVMDKIMKEQLPVVYDVTDRDIPDETDDFEEGDPEPTITPLDSELTESRQLSFGDSPAIPPGYTPPIPHKTISEQEAETKEKINTHLTEYAFKYRYRIERLNKEVYDLFNKSRSDMTIFELRRLLTHVKQGYPLNGKLTGKPGNSPPRGKGRRVPTKAEPWKPDQVRLPYKD